MKVKSFGCSFIFGSDLGDEKITGPVMASRKTWPALVAQHVNLDYECFARPGIGNLQILEKVLCQTDTCKPSDLVIINWTWIDRFDYYDKVNHRLHWQDWHTIRPSGTDTVSINYYKHIHSEYQDKLTNLIYVKTAIDILQAKNIKFIMTYMDQLMLDTTWYTSNAVATLQTCVRPHLTTFQGQTFLEWSRAHGFPESAGQHPLDLAHSSAAKYLIETYL